MPFLIKELKDTKPFIGYFGHGLNVFLVSSSDPSSTEFKKLSKDYMYSLANGNSLIVYKWVLLAEPANSDLINAMCLLKDSNDLLFLKITEELSVARVAHFLLSKITGADIGWTDNLELLHNRWAKLWEEIKQSNPKVHGELEKEQLKNVEEAMRELGFDGPHYDLCANIWCRWLLENKQNSIKEIFKIASTNEEFYGMYKIETYIELFNNKNDPDRFLEAWHISKKDYSDYIYELKSGKFMVIYTKMQLFENIPDSSMITTYQDACDQMPRNIHAANILLKMITGQSAQWETGVAGHNKMLRKWTDLIRRNSGNSSKKCIRP